MTQKEKQKEYDKLRYENNRETLLQKQKEYRESKKRVYSDEQKTNKKLYNKLNRIRINEYQKEYCKNKRKNDSLFKLTALIRTAIGEAFRINCYTKKSKTAKILGCSFEELKIHLESKFEPWMSWDNHGLYNGELNHGWDIDHIVPLSSITCENDIISLNHYTNLQPLCSYTNRYIKKDNPNF